MTTEGIEAVFLTTHNWGKHRAVRVYRRGSRGYGAGGADCIEGGRC
jgi:hypothetical protein